MNFKVNILTWTQATDTNILSLKHKRLMWIHQHRAWLRSTNEVWTFGPSSSLKLVEARGLMWDRPDELAPGRKREIHWDVEPTFLHLPEPHNSARVDLRQDRVGWPACLQNKW